SSGRQGNVHSPPPTSANAPRACFTGAILRVAPRPYSPVSFSGRGTGGGMTIKRVGVVGSGIMGSGVAEVAAKAGFEVVLRSRAQGTADAMVAGLEKSLTKQVDRSKLEASEREAILGRVRAVADLGELRECDLVIESIVE